MDIDGFYDLSGTVNGKQAWQNSDGIYLRWASMWTQWIFDDDTQDFTSIAWKSADASSTAPEIGTFSDYLYGSTCGNNAQVVDSLTITRIDCTTGNKVMKCAFFTASTFSSIQNFVCFEAFRLWIRCDDIIFTIYLK